MPQRHPIKKNTMRAQGEGNPVCSCLLPFSGFGFCLWRIPVHAAKFFRNTEKCIENKTRLTSLCKPKSDLQEGKVFWWSLGPWEMDLHLSSLLSPWRRRKKTPTLRYFILLRRTQADLSPGTINSFLTVTTAPGLWCGTLGE